MKNWKIVSGFRNGFCVFAMFALLLYAWTPAGAEYNQDERL